MEFVFRDLVTKCIWSWAGAIAAFALIIILATNTQMSNLQQGLLAIAAYLSLAIFFWQPLIIAARADHKHLLTVCVWSFFMVLLGVGMLFYAFYSITGDDHLKYDKILNVVPVLVAIWAAALGWFIHFRLSTKAHRTNNSFSIIMEMRKSAELMKRQETITRHFPPGVAVGVAYAPFFPSNSLHNLHHDAQAAQSDIEKVEAIAHLKYMLNYFEFMAVGIEAGDLDEELLYDTICTTVVGMFERSRLIVEYLHRDAPDGAGQHLAFSALKPLVKRWRARINADTAARNRA